MLRPCYRRRQETTIWVVIPTYSIQSSTLPSKTTNLAIAASLCFVQVLSAQGQVTHRREPSARQIAQRAFPSVVVLVTEDARGQPSSLGSGFFVDQDVVATNYHVIEGATRVYARIIGQERELEVLETVAVDEQSDLALVRLAAKARPLPLSKPSQMRVGDAVYVVGNPEGLEGTFSGGIVSALRGNKYIQITAPISHGSSGGPVLNRLGEVVGVAVGTIENGQNLNFAIPVSQLSTLRSRARSAPTQVARSTGPRTVSAAESLYRQGREYLKKGGLGDHANQEKAKDLFKRATEVDPKHIDAWVFLGNTYSLLGGHNEEAVQSYKRALQIQPDYAFAYSMLANHFLGKEFYQEAIEAYKEVIRLKPQSTEGYSGVGKAYGGLGRYQEELDAFLQAAKLKPDSFPIHKDLGDAYTALKRFDEAIREYKFALTYSPGGASSAFIYSDLSYAYTYKDEYESARQACVEAIRLAPSFPPFHSQLGRVYFHLKRYEDAVEELKEAARLDPKDASTHYVLGLSFLILGDKASALAEYRILKTLDAKLADELFNDIYK